MGKSDRSQVYKEVITGGFYGPLAARYECLESL